MKTASIGVFDSGFGGLTVFNAITSLLPNESISYFADTAHLPYGNKTNQQIIEYASQSIELLQEQGIKLLVIACHTASITFLPFFKKNLPFPVVSIAESSIQELTSQRKPLHLAFLATQKTVSSGFYQKRIKQSFPGVKVTGVACPLFVPLVENGYINHPILTKHVVQEELRPLNTSKTQIDSVLLACTHFPLLQTSIQKELGPEIHLLDPSMSCAKEVKKILKQYDLENNSSHPPEHHFYVSADPIKFQTIGKMFLPSLKERSSCTLLSSFS